MRILKTGYHKEERQMMKAAILCFVIIMMAFCLFIFISFIFDLIKKQRMKRIYEYEDYLNK